MKQKEIELVVCEICKKEGKRICSSLLASAIKEATKTHPLGNYRLCEIGIVCEKCYPQYKITRDFLKAYYNDSLQNRLKEIKI